MRDSATPDRLRTLALVTRAPRRDDDRSRYLRVWSAPRDLESVAALDAPEDSLLHVPVKFVCTCQSTLVDGTCYTPASCSY